MIEFEEELERISQYQKAFSVDEEDLGILIDIDYDERGMLAEYNIREVETDRRCSLDYRFPISDIEEFEDFTEKVEDEYSEALVLYPEDEVNQSYLTYIS